MNSLKRLLKSKNRLRKEIRSARRAISPNKRAILAHKLSKTLIQLDWFRQAKKIAIYIPSDGEIDPTGIIEIGNGLGKTFYLPVLKPIDEYWQYYSSTQSLWFCEYPRQNEPMVLNRFKILEPRYIHQSRRVNIHSLDLILLPLVGFDEKGNRLGMGGGFYDHTLSKLYNQHHPKRVGVAFELQKQAKLPTNDWDIPLHGIATEERFYRSPIYHS